MSVTGRDVVQEAMKWKLQTLSSAGAIAALLSVSMLIIPNASMCEESADTDCFSKKNDFLKKCRYDEVRTCIRKSREFYQNASGDWISDQEQSFKNWEAVVKDSKKLFIGDDSDSTGKVHLEIKSYTCSLPEGLDLEKCEWIADDTVKTAGEIEILQGSSCNITFEVKSSDDILKDYRITVKNRNAQLQLEEPSFRNVASCALKEHGDSGDKDLFCSLKAKSSKPIPPTSEPPPSPKPSRLGIGLTTGGGGVMVGGFVMLIISHVNLNGIEEHCVNDWCPEEYENKWDKNFAAYKASWALMAVGAAAAGVGLAFVVKEIGVKNETIGRNASINPGRQDSVKIGWRLGLGRDWGMALDMTF